MNSKKTLLSLINGNSILGSAGTGNQVTFAYVSDGSIGKVTSTSGQICFVPGTTPSIWVGGDLVSSKLVDLVPVTAKRDADAEKSFDGYDETTVTLTYIDSANKLVKNDVTFNTVDYNTIKAMIAASASELDARVDALENYAKATDVTGQNAIVVTPTADETTGFKTYDVTLALDPSANNILSQGANGLMTNLSIHYTPRTTGDNPTNASIELIGKNNTVISSIDATDFVIDGMLDSVTYVRRGSGTAADPYRSYLVFTWNTDSGKQVTEVEVSDLIDIEGIISADPTYMTATADSSHWVTLDLNMKTMAETSYTEGSVVTGLVDAADVKKYIDEKSTDLAVEITSRNAYINASVGTGADNKHIYVEAVKDNLSVSKEGNADSQLIGNANTLVDGGNAASTIQTFVGNRIAEEIDKLGNTADSSANFVKVEVTTENGDVNVVTVTEKIGSLTGTASAISGTAGLIDGAATATAISTYVEGRLDASIQALDASIVSDTTGHDISIYLEEVDGKVTTVGVEHTAATVTFTAKSGDTPASLTGSGSFVMGSDIEAIRKYVDAVAEAGFEGLDSEIEKKDASNFIGYKIGIVDGKLADASCSVTAVFGDYDKTSQADGVATTAATKAYIDGEIQSLDSTVTVADSENLVTVTTGIVDGKLVDASCSVTLDRGAFVAAPGSITVTNDGLVSASEVATAFMTAMQWQVIN